MASTKSSQIYIYGAGSIGAYVGGRLQAVGLPVSFIGRPRIAGQIAQHGLHLSDWQGAKISLPASAVDFRTDDDGVEDADLIIVAVKSAATLAVAEALAGRLRKDTVVLSLQNGIGNARNLSQQLPDNPVLSGMISFNVLQRGEGRFHAGTEGELMSEPHPLLEGLLPAFREAALPLELREDMHAVQWAKLLMNLNNAINALAGIPLKEELSQRAYRHCLALLVRETLQVLKRAGIQPAKLMPVPMSVLPMILRVPDGVFRHLAGTMLAIDPLARSSMWEDLENGRTTEIDWLNGEVIRQARALGVAAPANEKVLALIKAAEAGGRRDWGGEELLGVLKAAAR